MLNRSQFAEKLRELKSSHLERAVALLWFYKHTQEFEERTASDLTMDLHTEGFPRPNVTLLARALTKSKLTIRGKRKGTFQIDTRAMPDLDFQYGPLLKIKKQKVSDSVIPVSLFNKIGRQYIIDIVTQINGAYENGWYDACAVLCRRLMESLIVEIFISKGLKSKIEINGKFVFLEKLISLVRIESAITLGRNTPKTMEALKEIGDTAAHDRAYITQQQDIDDIKMKLRPMFSNLLQEAGLK